MAAVPALALLALIVWQVVVTAHSLVVAGSAARAGARAAEVGAPVDAAVGAAGGSRARRVESARAGASLGRAGVVVRVPVPRVVRRLPALEWAEASADVGP